MTYLIKTLFLALSLIICSPAFAADMPAPLNFGPKETLTVVSSNAEHNFLVEVADTRAEQSRGYMFRDVVPVDEGMLFEFGEPRVQSIWMKNTSVFLDVLFVRGDGRILKIEHSAKPYSLRSMTSEAPVSAVLELAGGQALERGIQAGDIIQHEFFKNTQK